jgi:glycosyltransferase involved in cell wall biosynthesis
MKSLHVCFICNEYPPAPHGGIGTMVQALARALVQKGHRVTVVGVYQADRVAREDDKKVQVIRIPHAHVPKLGIVANAVRLRKTIRELHRESPIDVLEGPEGSLAFLPHRSPFPRIVRMNGGHTFFAKTLGKEPAFVRSQIERNSFSKATDLLAVGRYVADETARLLGIDRPITVIANSVDTGRLTPSPESIEEGLIVFVGTVCEKKGIRQLIQGLPAIVAAVPNARLEVAGRDWDEPEVGGSFTEYLKTVVDPSVADRVTFLGAVPNDRLPDLLGRASVVACPSHMEALPLVWLEALACGKPLVASRRGPGPEVVEDGVSGLLCDPYDPQDVAEKTIALLTDRDLASRVSQNARARAVETFSVHNVVERNIDFYRGCVARFAGR